MVQLLEISAFLAQVDFRWRRSARVDLANRAFDFKWLEG